MDKLTEKLVAFGKKNKACMALALFCVFFLYAFAMIADNAELAYRALRGSAGRRIAAAVLAFCMVFTLLPAAAFATEGGSAVPGASGVTDVAPGASGVVLPLITGFAPLDGAIRTQRVGADDLVLPETLLATVDGEETELPVTWDGLDAVNEARKSGGLFVLTANVGEGYRLAEGVTAPTISAMILGEGRILGAGTEANPLQLSTEAQLREIAVLTNAGKLTETVFGPDKTDKVYIKLMNDLDISGSQWTPIGTLTNKFAASFNGNGHTITGLTINQPTMDYVGLFGYTGPNTTIQNLGVTGVNVAGAGYVGGLAGYTETNSAVTNCYVTGSVTGSSYSVGGVVGEANNSEVTGCYSTASVTSGNASGGGVVGCSRGVVSNCYSTGAVSGSGIAGGVVGAAYADVTNCYATGTVSGKSYVGGVVGDQRGGKISNCVALNPAITDTGINPKVERVVGGLVTSSTIANCSAFAGMTVNGSKVTDGAADNKDGADIANLATLDGKFNDTSVWNTFDDTTLPTLVGVGQQTLARPAHLRTTPFNGAGTQDDPYQIATAEQLRELARLVNSGDTTYNASTVYYKLTADLDISGSEWAPIGNGNAVFKSNFDGDGHTITGLTIFVAPQGAGLFGIATGTIENLGVINVNVTGGFNLGGVVGNSRGVVSNCYSTGSITGTTVVGGVAGAAMGTITNCYSTATITGTTFVGGVTGSISGTASNCVALNPTITATGNSPNVGRVAGEISGSGSASGCYAFAGMTVNGSKITDGTATNKNGANITDLATLDGKFTDADGWSAFTAETLPTLKSAEENSTLDRPAHLLAVPFKGAGTQADPYQISTADQLLHLGTLVNGGDRPYNANAVCYKLTADLDISGSQWTPIGNSNRSFVASFDGDGHTITGLTINQPTIDYVGLFGNSGNNKIQNLGVINVNVTGKDNVGGVAGYANQVSNCYVTGTVTGGGKVGGVAGYAYQVTKCYATGTVTGSGDSVGGVAGYVNAKMSYCYATGTVTGVNKVGGVMGECIGSFDSTCIVALNPSVTSTGVNVGRVAGAGNFITCYAYTDMKVNGVKVTSGMTNNINGADVTKFDLKRASWWKEISTSFNENWALADNNLPALKTTGGTLMAGQNTDLPVFLTELPTADTEAGRLVIRLNTMQADTAEIDSEDPTKVNLLKDITLTGPIPIEDDLTLDTQTFTITGKEGNSDSKNGGIGITIISPAKVTITGSGGIVGGKGYDNPTSAKGGGGGIGVFGNVTLSGSVTITGGAGGDTTDFNGYGVQGDVTLNHGVTIIGGGIGRTNQAQAVSGTITAGTDAPTILGGYNLDVNYCIVNSGEKSDQKYIKARILYNINKTPATPGTGTYDVEINSRSTTKAAEGSTVTIAPWTDPLYVADTVTVTQIADGIPVDVNIVNPFEFTFTMPACEVTVSVSFTTHAEKLVKDLNAMQAGTAEVDSASTKKVNLLKSITLTDTITIVKNITLDTQNYTITGAAGTSGSIDGKAAIAIIDSAASVTITGSGGIVGGAGGPGVKGIVNLWGNVTITGGASGSGDLQPAVNGKIFFGSGCVVKGGDSNSTITNIIQNNTTSLYPYIKAHIAYNITKTNSTSGSFTVKVGTDEVTIAAVGDIVTVTPTANSDYEVDAVTVTKTGSSTTVTVTNNTFIMPAYAVTVKVTFKALSPAEKLVKDLNAMQAGTAAIDSTDANKVNLLRHITLTDTITITIAGDLTLDTQTYSITGKAGVIGTDTDGSKGSDAITITSPAKVTIIGSGSIVGGAGGSDKNCGYDGGIGVKGNLTVNDSVSITGGAGGDATNTSGIGEGGNGGAGVFGSSDVNSNIILKDSVKVTGGAGGAGSSGKGGNGGPGTVGNNNLIFSTSLNDSATVTGGRGGNGGSGGRGGNGGSGVQGSAHLYNDAAINGGAGGTGGGTSLSGGNGGSGVYNGGVSLYNDATINGGDGGTGGGGTGGIVTGGIGVEAAAAGDTLGTANLHDNAAVTGGMGSNNTRARAVFNNVHGTMVRGGNSADAITNVIPNKTQSHYPYIRSFTAYHIVKAPPTNGSFTVTVGTYEVTDAAEGDIVTVTPTAASDYEVDAVTVTKTTNPNDTVTVNSDNAFTMPAYGVTVTVTFKGTPDRQAVTAAMNAVVNSSVNVDFGADQDAKTEAVLAYVNSKLTDDAAGVTATVTYTDGNSYLVEFNKGSVTDSKTITMTVNVAPDPDIAIVAAAKTAVENGTYTTTQAATDTEAKANTYVKNIATTAVNNSGVTVTVNKMSYTAPVAGTSADPDGTDGSYKFTVTVTKGAHSATTAEITLTITATEFTGVTDVQAVAAANTAAENATYTATTQAATDTEAKAEAYVKDIATTAVNNSGVTVKVNGISYTAPVAGTSADPDGTDGSYKFTVTVTKGTQSATTAEITLTITATAFTGVTDVQAVAAAMTAVVDGSVNVAFGATQADKTAAVQTYVDGLLSAIPNATGVTATVKYNIGTGNYDVALIKGSVSDSKTITMTVNVAPDPDIATIAAAKSAAEGANYTATTQAACTDEYAAKAHVANIAITAVNNSSVIVMVNKVSYTAPVAGTSADPNGTDGSYVFTVTVLKGLQFATTAEKTLTITATAFTGVTDVQAVAAAMTAVVDSSVTVAIGADQAAKTDAVQSYVNGLLSGNAAGVNATVTHTDGNSYLVEFNKGSVTENKTITMTVIESNDPDIATVTAAKTAAENANYTATTQAATGTEAQAEAYVKNIATTAVNNSGVTVTVNKMSYTAPVAGTSADPDGTDGSYKFTVTVSKGTQSATTAEITLTITATAFTGVTDVQAVAAAMTAVVDGSVNVAFGATQTDKTAAVQTYVDGLLSAIPNATGVTATVTYNIGTGNYDVALIKGSVSDSKTITMTVNVAPGAAPGGTVDTTPTQEELDAVFGPGGATLGEDGKITIDADITLTESVIINATPTTIDLNGHTITGAPGKTPIVAGDGVTVIITGEGAITGGDATTGAGGNGITGGAGSNITIGQDVTVSGGDGTTGGNGIQSGGNVTVDGSVSGGNGSSGNGGDGVDTSGGTGDITIGGNGSATGGNSTGGNGNGGNGTNAGGNTVIGGDVTGGNGNGSGSGGDGATDTAGGSGSISVPSGGSSTGGNGGSNGGSGGDGVENNGGGSTTIGGDTTGGNGGSSSTGTGGAGGNGSTSTGSGSIDVSGSSTGGTGGASSGAAGGNGGNGSTSTGGGNITVGGESTGGTGGNGATTGGDGGDGTTTDGNTEINGGGSASGGTGGTGTTGGGGNGGSGSTSDGGNITIDNGSTTGGTGGNGATTGGTGGDGSTSDGGNITIDNGSTTGGNGGNGATTGGTGGDGSTTTGDGTVDVNNGSASGGSGGTGTSGAGGEGGNGAVTDNGNITVGDGNSTGTVTGGSGGSGATGGAGGSGSTSTGGGSVDINTGSSAAGGDGGSGSSGAGGAGGNGTTTNTGGTTVDGSTSGGTDGTTEGGAGGSGATTGGNGGNGSTSTGGGNISVDGNTTGGSGGNGAASGGNGGSGTTTGGNTTVNPGGNTSGGNGGNATGGGNNATGNGGAGGNGSTSTGSGSTTVNGGATGGSGGNASGNGNGGNGGAGVSQGSGTVGGNGTVTGGNGGNGSGTGDGGTGGAAVGGGASAGTGLTEKPGANGRKAITEVDDSQAGTTVTVPDRSTLTDAALTEAEKYDPDITEVKVVLNVKKENNPADKDKVEEVLKLPTVAADTIGAFFDITLDKVITKTSSGAQPIEKVENASTEIEITITIPTDMRGGSDYVVIRVHKGTGKALDTTQSGDDLTFKTDKFSTYAIAYTKSVTPPPPIDNTDNGSSSDNDEYDFWMTVKEKIRKADSGDVVKVNGKGYDKVPWSVMDALHKNDGVSLVITWNDKTITIPAGKAQKNEAGRIYWPLSKLAELYAGIAEDTILKPAEDINPETGGSGKYIPVTGGNLYELEAPAPAVENTLPDAAENAQAITPTQPNAITPPDAGFEADAFAGTPDAKAARGTNGSATAGFITLLVALCGSGVWFWKRRSQTEKQ